MQEKGMFFRLAYLAFLPVFAGLSGCGLLLENLLRTESHHYVKGREYTEQAKKLNDDIPGLRESIRLLSLALKEHKAGAKSDRYPHDRHENGLALKATLKELKRRRSRLAAVEAKAKREVRKAALTAALEENWDNDWKFTATFQTLKKEFRNHRRMPEFESRMKEHLKSRKERAAALRKEREPALVSALEENKDDYEVFAEKFRELQNDFPNHPRMPEFESWMKEHLRAKREQREARYADLLERTKKALKDKNLDLAFASIAEAKRLGQSYDLSKLTDQLRAAFEENPEKITGGDQARWFYKNPLSYWDFVRKGLSRGDVLDATFQIHQRFDYHYYRAEIGGSQGVEVVIYSPTALPHGNPSAFIRALVRVKGEKKFQRAFGTTAVLPVVEILYRTL